MRKWFFISCCFIILGSFVFLFVASYELGDFDSHEKNEFGENEHFFSDDKARGEVPFTEESNEINKSHHSELESVDHLQGHVKRLEKRVFKLDLQEIGQAFDEGSVENFSLSLFGEETVEVILRKHRRIDDHIGTITGSIEGYELSQIVLSYVGGAVSGMIRIPEEGLIYEIRNQSGAGGIILSEFDSDELGQCATCRPNSASVSNNPITFDPSEL